MHACISPSQIYPESNGVGGAPLDES